MRRLVPVHTAALVLLVARLYALHSWEQAPADLPKDAASIDLPIALGILIGSGQAPSERLEHYAVVGDLALDGNARPTKGPGPWPWPVRRDVVNAAAFGRGLAP